MLTVVIGFSCDYPGCGETSVRRRASEDPRSEGDDFDPPEGWHLIQVSGKDEAKLFCAAHPLRLEGGAAVLAKRVGFDIAKPKTPKENP